MTFENAISLGGVLSPVVTIIVGSVVAEYVRRVGKKADAAADNAQLAADRSEPTGNGYAGRTEGALSRIEADLRHVRRDVGGLRQDVRATNARVDHLGHRLDQHLDTGGAS